MKDFKNHHKPSFVSFGLYDEVVIAEKGPFEGEEVRRPRWRQREEGVELTDSSSFSTLLQRHFLRGLIFLDLLSKAGTTGA